MPEPWFKISCSNCKATNWFTPSTAEAYEYDACKCWSCGKKFWIEEDESLRADFVDEDTTVDEADWVEGSKQPR